MNSSQVYSNFTNFTATESAPEQVTCFTLKFVIAFVIIGSVCILGMIGNFLSLLVLTKIKVCEKKNKTFIVKASITRFRRI